MTDLDEKTETLLLRRALGRAEPVDYVNWAVDQLCRNVDGPNLCILAGLSPRLERDEIEQYFVLSCRELDLPAIGAGASRMETVCLIRRAFERGDIPPTAVIDMMSDLYESSNYEEELLVPWSDMSEELTWREGYFYPPAALASVEHAVRREWSLLDRAIRLDLPKGWLRLKRCTGCGHFGEACIEKPLLLRIVKALWARQPAVSRVVCARCGSSKLSNLQDPDARAAYLECLEQGEYAVSSGSTTPPR
jgi:hypothetical protein